MIKAGNIIKVTGDKAKVIKDISAHIQASRTLANHAGEVINIFTKQLWDCINEIYPETKGYELAYIHDKQEIHIKCKN